MVSDDDLILPPIGYQPTSEELLHAVREAKSQNPEFGIKRILGLLKDKGLIVSEQRVKKVMQEDGLTEIRTAIAPDSSSKDEIKITEAKCSQPVRHFCCVFHIMCLRRVWQNGVEKQKKTKKKDMQTGMLFFSCVHIPFTSSHIP